MRERPIRRNSGKASLALVAVGALLLASMGAPACRRGDRYAQTLGLVTRYMDALDAFSGAVEKAKDSKAIVAAMDTWVETAWSLAPHIKILGQTRPELADPASLPADLQALLARLDAAHARMLAAMAKAMQYADNPAVPAARARLESIQKLLE
jgi:hypothetical protein